MICGGLWGARGGGVARSGSSGRPCAPARAGFASGPPTALAGDRDRAAPSRAESPAMDTQPSCAPEGCHNCVWSSKRATVRGARLATPAADMNDSNGPERRGSPARVVLEVDHHRIGPLRRARIPVSHRPVFASHVATGSLLRPGTAPHRRCGRTGRARAARRLLTGSMESHIEACGGESSQVDPTPPPRQHRNALVRLDIGIAMARELTVRHFPARSSYGPYS